MVMCERELTGEYAPVDTSNDNSSNTSIAIFIVIGLILLGIESIRIIIMSL